MRISNSMVYDSGVRTINDQMSQLLKTQQMLSTGRRILTPADDPVNAARALVVTESKNINTQFAVNQRNARGALELEEAQLSSVNDILARVRELTVQSGDAALSYNDLTGITTELKARFDELMGIANSTDGNGDYIFSGYMGTTKPFGGNVDALLAASGNEIAYFGDEGQRRLQVSPTRYLEISDSGNEIFRRVRNGNGNFVTGYNPANSGTGIIDAGSVTNTTTWNNLANKDYDVQFWVDTNGIVGAPGDTYYDIVDTTANISLLTGLAPVAPTVGPPATFPAGLRKYYDNQPIDLKSQGAEPAFDLGSNIRISGAPADGDSFSLAPSTTQSVFKTLSTVIGAIEDRLANRTPSGSAALLNEVGFALTNFDQANESILKVRAAIGSRLNELESLGNVNQDVSLRYDETLSSLQDVDYAKSISDLQRNQANLDAAQKSFMRVSQLTLFSYL